MKKSLALIPLGLSFLPAADVPHAEITNGQIEAKMYLPDAKNGYYRATRFDWSGVIYSLRYNGHEYYGPWFQKTDPTVHDFVYRGRDIVASPCTAITGPVDEFAPLGWNEAKPGASFIKIGVGALRRPDAAKYDNYRLYEIIDPGKRTIQQDREFIGFTQELADAPSGYAYTYRKTLRLTESKPEMVMEHSLKTPEAAPSEPAYTITISWYWTNSRPARDLSLRFRSRFKRGALPPRN